MVRFMEEKCLHCGETLQRDTPYGRDADAPASFFLKKLWRGEYPLAVAFWFFYFAVNFAINALFYTNPRLLIALFGLDSERFFITVPLFLLLYFSYLILCLTGVWRSAARYEGRKLWAGLARIYTTLSALNTLRLTYDFILTPLFFLYQIWRMGAL